MKINSLVRTECLLFIYLLIHSFPYLFLQQVPISWSQHSSRKHDIRSFSLHENLMSGYYDDPHVTDGTN